MRSLWENIHGSQRNINEEKNIISLSIGYVYLWEEMTRAEIRKRHQDLYEEEKRHLESLKRR
jgi:hypothetical protein